MLRSITQEVCLLTLILFSNLWTDISFSRTLNLDISDIREEISLGPYLEFIKTDLDDPLKISSGTAYIEVESENPNFGYTQDRYWARLRFHNSGGPKKMVFDMRGIISHADMIDSQGRLHTSGIYFSLEAGMPLSRYPIFLATIPEGDSTFYFQNKTVSQQFPLFMHSINGYDGINLKSRAYRIKEMGDGFLCSIGFPFDSMSENAANDAVELARMFEKALFEESKILHFDEPITCGIGIAIDTLSGFYPESGTKEYDLFGPGLILATRYENLRKILFSDERRRSILIIQEIVYKSIDPNFREGFEAINLKEIGVVVRDDPNASRVYYRFLDSSSHKEMQPLDLKAV